ncbi:MAG: hypothetical protein ACI955_000467 [Zhongshania sp.]|jgi:hypothetical protein
MPRGHHAFYYYSARSYRYIKRQWRSGRPYSLLYTMGKETLALSYRNDQHIRVDRSQLGYSIINGDQAIAVLQQGDARIVMSVDKIGDIIKGSQSG